MLIYLDMCCLKRLFDDQTQPRIHLETEAVLNLLASEPDRIQIVRSPALLLENDLNPLRERALRVELWLRAAPHWQPADLPALQYRVGNLIALGFKSFDALHVAKCGGGGSGVVCDY